MRLCLVVLLLCTPGGGPGPGALTQFTAANTEGDTLFKAVAAVCYAKGGDPRMSACLPNGDQCPAGKTEPQCLEAWFQCCLEGR